jgi:ABC-type lipoprotein release transport system permease subunit
MRSFRAWLVRLAGGLTRTKHDRNFADELVTNLQAYIDDRVVDPATFGLVATLLAPITLIARYAPATRATRIHPIVALRAE